MAFAEDTRIAAVVVTYNRPVELRKVILALKKQSRSLDQIIVLDNACEVPAAATLSNVEKIEVIRSSVNSGGAGGFALGLEAALRHSPDWIWLMDDDAVPRNDALAELLNAIPKVPGRAGALCSSVYEDGELALVHRRSYSPVLVHEVSVARSYYEQNLTEIDTGSFVGFMVRSVAVRQIGVPEKDFFLAYDDTEYSLRLIRNGWRNWLVPASGIDHLRTRQSRLRTSSFGSKHYYNIRNRIVVALRYGRWPLLAGSVATLVGTGLWLACGGYKGEGSQLFARAVRDGWTGVLGPLSG
jgi:GT2 family glycosyltransferase